MGPTRALQHLKCSRHQASHAPTSRIGRAESLSDCRLGKCNGRLGDPSRSINGISTSSAPTFSLHPGKSIFPAYKKGALGHVSENRERESTLRTEDTCHLPPRADLIPRRFSSIAIAPRLRLPVERMTWMTGANPRAN